MPLQHLASVLGRPWRRLWMRRGPGRQFCASTTCARRAKLWIWPIVWVKDKPVLEGFLHLFARRPPALAITDVADILLVAYVVYRALLVLRGTRAMQMGIGLGVISVVYLVSN